VQSPYITASRSTLRVAQQNLHARLRPIGHPNRQTQHQRLTPSPLLRKPPAIHRPPVPRPDTSLPADARRNRAAVLGVPDVRVRPSDDDSSIRNVLEGLGGEKRSANRHVAVHKEEVELGNVWEVLPQLRGLRTMVLWGCYFTWGTERDLARKMLGIQVAVEVLVGREVEVTSIVEPLEEGE
jgi:hypothetical protein